MIMLRFKLFYLQNNLFSYKITSEKPVIKVLEYRNIQFL